MTKQANSIKWQKGAEVKNANYGEPLYICTGDFEWAGSGTFWITYTKTIGKPYALNFASNCGTGERQFLGAFATASGAKQRAKKFGTWRN